MKLRTMRVALGVALIVPAASTVAAPVGYGRNTTGGGGAIPIQVSTMQQMQDAIDDYSGSGGLVLNYTGTFNFASITNVCAQWQLPAKIVQIKNKRDITIKGANGSSANFGLHIAGDAHNIIVQNMTIGLLPGGEAADSISIEGMSSGQPSDIWIDHNTLFASLTHCDGAGDASFDGGIDLKKGANNITISYNHVYNYQKVALNGHSDSDTTNDAARTTYHHNRFENVESRLPLQRRGRSHIYNNYFGNVATSGINVRMGGIALIESNYFENVRNPVTSRDSTAIGYWDLINNHVGSGITWGTPSGSKPWANATTWISSATFPGPLPYMYSVTPAAQVKAKVFATAGAGTNLAE